ncbi:MAG: hypothetical protein ACRCTZ_21485 [Sarcina sp.]
MNINNLKAGFIVKNYRELCLILEIKETTGNSKKAQLKELNRYCKYQQEGRKFIIEEIFNVTDIKTKQERKDKGQSRENYSTIRDQFKPLIYSLVASKDDYTYTGGFNNWMEYSKITTQAWSHMNIKYNEGQITSKDLNDFFRIEGRSLNYMFQTTLSSMEQEGAIVKEDVRIAVIDNQDIIEEFGNKGYEIPYRNYKILKDNEKRKIDVLETRLLREKYNVDKLSDLAYGNKEKGISRDFVKLKEFKNEFNSLILKKYGYHMCYRATTVKIENVDMIQTFKEKYGITEDMQAVVSACKQNIYDSRLKKAETRYEKPIVEATGSWYETPELIKELKEERDNNLKTWDGSYKKYIYTEANNVNKQS